MAKKNPESAVKKIADSIKNKKTNNLAAKHSISKTGAGKMHNREKDIMKGKTRKDKHKGRRDY